MYFSWLKRNSSLEGGKSEDLTFAHVVDIEINFTARSNWRRSDYDLAACDDMNGKMRLILLLLFPLY